MLDLAALVHSCSYKIFSLVATVNKCDLMFLLLQSCHGVIFVVLLRKHIYILKKIKISD